MSWQNGSTRAWRRVRAAVLARDRLEGWACRAHDEGWCARSRASPHVCTEQPEVVHHTWGRGRTGDNPAYLVASCAPCNLAIGEPAPAAADPPAVPITSWR